MARSWNTTGLYRASKDRMPAKRSRKIKGATPTAKLVLLKRAPICKDCGWAEDTHAHRAYCASSDRGAA